MDIAELAYKIDAGQLPGVTAALEKNTAAAGRTEKATDKLEASWKRMGKTIGVGIGIIGGVAVAAFSKYIRATIEAERVQAQLEQRIKSTKGVAGLTAVELNKMAASLQAATTFDDESITEAQSLLLTFTKIGRDEFPRATEAVLDMSIALGTDLKGAALQVGKALNDPILGITALGRAGVQFSESQKKLIKDLVETGERAKAQAIILRELETQMGGSARAARNTLGGALEGLKNTVDNLLEGDSGGAGMTGMVTAVNDLNSSLGDPELKRGIDGLAEGLLAAANAAVKGAAMLGNFIGKYREFLSSKGFAVADDTTSLEDLQTRLTKLQNQSGKAMTRWLAGDEIASQIKETKDLMAAFPFRGVTTNVDSTTFGKAAGGEGGTSGTKASTGSRKAMELPDFSKDAVEELQELIAAQGEARSEFDAMAATLAGPMAEASFRYAVDLEKLRELASQGEIGTDQLTKAEADLAAQHKLTIEGIEAGLNPTKKMLEDLEFERALIGKSNVDREIAIAQRWAHVDAMSAEGKSLAESIRMNRELERAQAEQIATMDALREGGKSFVVDIGNGVKPIDAIGDALDRLYQKMLAMAAEKLMDQIFGTQGGSAGGSGNGWLDALMGIVGGMASGGTGDVAFGANSYGGAMANGGSVRGGRFYQTGERNRPELLNMGGKQYLIPGDQGRVEPMGGGGMSPVYVTQNFTSPGRFDQATIQQAQHAASIAMTRVAERNK